MDAAGADMQNRGGNDNEHGEIVNNANDDIDNLLTESVRNAILERSTKLRPSLQRMMSLSHDELQRDIQAKIDREMREWERPASPIEIYCDMNIETMNSLLSSNLVKLTPAEEERARCSCYPIFKDSRDEMYRDSFLYDGIPFEICNPRPMKTMYQVYFSDETIDWRALAGWEVPSAIKTFRSGYICFQKGIGAENQNDLLGSLIFMPYGDRDEVGDDSTIEVYEYDSGDQALHYDSDDVNNGSDGENDGSNQRNVVGDNRVDENNANLSISDRGDNEIEDDIMSTSDSEIDDSLEDQEFGSEDEEGVRDDEDGSHSWSDTVFDTYIKEHSLLNFNLQSFEIDREYEENSWSRSNSYCSFGIKRNDDQDNQHRVSDGNDSVTVFEVNEMIAFERGTKQKFVSLENPRNYGTECGSHHAQGWRARWPEENDRQRMKVLERMQAYRGSWIAKLCPRGMRLPDAVTENIGQYLMTSPPPYLIVQKGDLLLLARYDDSVQDPEFPDLFRNTVTRELLVLAHPC